MKLGNNFSCVLSIIKQFPSPKGSGNYFIMDKKRVKLFPHFNRLRLITLIHISRITVWLSCNSAVLYKEGLKYSGLNVSGFPFLSANVVFALLRLYQNLFHFHSSNLCPLYIVPSVLSYVVLLQIDKPVTVTVFKAN